MKDLAGCSSEALYYGIGSAADFPRARLCAQREVAQGDELVFGGSAILMMIYANGKGVAPDEACAIHFACRVDGTPAELAGRMEHLHRRAADPALAPLDLCDDVTSGFMMGHCAGHRERVAETERAGALAALSAHWSAREKAALRALQDAARAFFEERGRSETHSGGTARAAEELEVVEAMWRDWMASLESFERGRLPQFSEADRAAAERTLSSTYDAVTGKGTGARAALRKTQRAWLRYREAWVRFGAVRYPGVPASSWRTWLIRSRIHVLAE